MSDRPPGRSLVRLGALALGRARAHRQDLWPWLAIDRHSGVVRWRGRVLLQLKPLAAVIPRGLGILSIIGTGPSLRDQHPERLSPRSTILLNGAAILAPRIAPLAIAVEDERFVFRHHAMLAQLPPDVPLLLSPAALRAMAERGPALLRNRPVSLIDNIAKPVNGRRRSLDDKSLDGILRRSGPAALSRDPQAGVVITGTVAFSAMQIALGAAPAGILLAGIDLGNADGPRFYETEAEAAPSGILKGLPRILSGFALARDEATARGIRLGCASPVSALLDLGYPRENWLD